MATAAQPSKLTALLTLFFFLGIIVAVSIATLQLVSGVASENSTPRPTPTPVPGTFNIDEQLDMLNE